MRSDKSPQTLMSEDSKWKSSVTQDLMHIYSSLKKVLPSQSLPSLPASPGTAQDPAMSFDQGDPGNDPEADDHSYDSSPLDSPVNENLGHAPIGSLYQITGLRSLKFQEPGPEERERTCKALPDPDFISRGHSTCG